MFFLEVIRSLVREKKIKFSIISHAVKFLVNKYFLTNIIEKEDILYSVKKNLEIEPSNVKTFKQLIKNS